MAGHLILVRPHTSLLDGPAVARYLGQIGGGHRSYLFAIDPDYARHPIYRRLLSWYGRMTGGHRMVPLDTRSPMSIRQVLHELTTGGGVVLFPQGTGLSDAKRPDLPGAEWLIRKSRCCVTVLSLDHSRLIPKVIFAAGSPPRHNLNMDSEGIVPLITGRTAHTKKKSITKEGK